MPASTWVNPDDALGLIHMIRTRIATAGKVEDTETLRIARQWIAAQPERAPFFLGMNLQNTHFNYVIPKGGPEPFQPSVMDFPTPYFVWPRERVTDVRNRYLNACFNVDIALRKFVAFLKARGLWDRCLFAVLGDGGEAFYEHDFGNHSGSMYDETMRTVLLIKPPRGGPTGVIDRPTSHVDIFPTILRLLGLPNHPSFQGIPALGEQPRRLVYLQANALVVQDGLVYWPWKYLVSQWPPGHAELYNLLFDPGERHNLADSDPALARLLRDALMRFRTLQLSYYETPEQVSDYDPPRP